MTAKTFTVQAGVALCLVALMTGCALDNHAALTPDEQRRLNIDGEISDSLSLAVNAQRELALTRDANVQQRATARSRLLTDRVSYDFYGDVEKIVSDIAYKYGYDFKVYGQRPPEHVNVNIFVKKMRAVDVLQYVGQTATDWIDIRIDPGVISLTYKKPGNAGV
ncbi:DotD/TraH family lipoprotein [Burkholderia vietnamiensis]|uniref:DotD/TraH family lipoprotein n=1 Tax=Burkholderia cepacia complex TaxID=87882 RepID=UPI001588437A|nr:DotD/TraH family lipoprotein [Burkholderia vietnamiensis]MCA8197388.1 DotD/TraH family lipoprotein [Burkholderia vietnamiensis]MCA8228158.1 DotD/TraH family lipoprotein [Burkholderia vietnamiensis]UEC05552.1 DotD/TraH family lipoprotein [Burkholderia vietnamiensis]